MVRIEGEVNAPLEQDIIDPSLLPLPALAAVALPVAWDIESAWKDYYFKLSDPFMKYFTDMVMGHNCLGIWRAASLADPLNMHRTAITPAYLRAAVAPLLNKLFKPALVDSMIGELSEYDKACSKIDWIHEKYSVRLGKVEAFWSTHKLLPAWTEFAHLVFLLQPTSACAERAFSILKYIMGDQQVSLLIDKIEASLMLKYNRGLNK